MIKSVTVRAKMSVFCDSNNICHKVLSQAQSLAVVIKSLFGDRCDGFLATLLSGKIFSFSVVNI